MKSNIILKSIKEIGILTIALSAALVINYAYGAWSDPTCGPTGCNVAIPLNEGNGEQTKNGWLDLNGMKITSGAPAIIFHDGATGGAGGGDRDARITNNQSSLYFQTNTNNNISSPSWKTQMVIADNTGESDPDFVRFYSQVRASEYCDQNGNNCSTGVGGGTGGRIMGEIASTGQDWPDIIVCNWNTSAGVGPLLYVFGGVYDSSVHYKSSDNMTNSGNEVMVSFSKADGSYVGAQGLGGDCLRNIQQFIASGEAYYHDTGWVNGSLPISYAWIQDIVSACNAPAATCAVSPTTGSIEYNVYCASSANPSVPVANSNCSGLKKPADGVHTCYDFVDFAGSCR